MTFRTTDLIIDDITKLDIPKNTISIVLPNKGLKNVPKDFFTKYPFIESIELQGNLLTELNFTVPQTVTFIDLSHNKLDRNSIKVPIPVSLETINVTGNPYHNFMALENAGIIEYGSVTVTNNRITKEPEQRPRNNQATRHIQSKQTPVIDVHRSSIQENVRKSISYILKKRKYTRNSKKEIIKKIYNKYYKNNYFERILNLNNAFWDSLTYYASFDNDIIYDYQNDLACKMIDLLNGIYSIAEETEDTTRMSILESLRTQMEDGTKHCFVGKYTRVVNSLNSFDPNISIDFTSNSEKISNEYNFLKSRITSAIKEKNIEDIYKDLVRELKNHENYNDNPLIQILHRSRKETVTSMTKYMNSLYIPKEEQ